MATTTVNIGGRAPYTDELVVAGATATTTTDLVLSPGCDASGLVIVVNISSFTSGSLTVTVSAVSSSGYTYTLLASAALGAAATTALQIGRGLTAASNTAANALVPQEVQVAAVVSGGGSLVYGIDYILAR